MPANKFAAAGLNSAYLRLVHAVTEAEPPAFTLHPTADQFEYAKKHLIDVASAFDDYIHTLAIEANSNSTTTINSSDRIAIVSNALHDSSLLGDLDEAAERLHEESAERCAR